MVSRVKQMSSNAASPQSKKAFRFVGEVKSEFKKVSWTTKEELVVYTKMVVLSTFAFGMMIYFMDLGVRGVLQSIQSFVHMLTG